MRRSAIYQPMMIMKMKMSRHNAVKLIELTLSQTLLDIRPTAQPPTICDSEKQSPFISGAYSGPLIIGLLCFS